MSKFFPLVAFLCFVSTSGCLVLGALWYVDHQKLQTDYTNLQSLVAQERDYKLQLQQLLDQSLNSGAELRDASSNLAQEFEDYDRNIQTSFRVINGKTELLPDANGTLIRNSQSQVETELDNVNRKIDKFTETKDEINSKVSQIFSSSNQNLQNRADPRDGVRK